MIPQKVPLVHNEGRHEDHECQGEDREQIDDV